LLVDLLLTSLREHLLLELLLLAQDLFLLQLSIHLVSFISALQEPLWITLNLISGDLLSHTALISSVLSLAELCLVSLQV
jgi:hypothetical protein